MSQVVTEEFRKSIRSSPTGKRKNGTVFDELYTSLESSENPLDRAVQTISEFHGPWSGSSLELADFNTFVASKIGAPGLKNSAIQNSYKALDVNSAVGRMPSSSVGKFNRQTFAVMPTPLLREFINRSQKMHPAINMYIQMHIGSFPYYQQISEDVGQYANIVMNRTSVDPMKWPDQNGSNCLDTNGRFDKNTAIKLAGDILSLMDDANNLTNALFLRSMPKSNNMSFMHPNYSSESPIAHGHNFTMDVFNGQREQDAIGPSMAAILNLSGDLLRLVSKFFCIKELARYDVEGFNITLNEGPNGEPITYVVDNTGRPMFDNSTSNEITDPTNDSVIGTKDDCIDELQ